MLRSCIKMASGKAKCSNYVQSHIYVSQGVNPTPFEALARHWFPGTKRKSPNFSHLVWNPANLRLSSGPDISSRWFYWNAFIRILANCLLNHPPKLRQFFLLQNDTCFTKICQPGVSKCDGCAMDLVLQSAMIIRNCDITAFGTNFFTQLFRRSRLLLCHFALSRGIILVATPSIFESLILGQIYLYCKTILTHVLHIDENLL